MNPPESHGASLDTPIAALYRVGPRAVARLKKLGIETVKQLLWHLPSRYEDYSAEVPISAVAPGTVVSIRGRIRTIADRHIWPRRLHVTTATVEDDSGAVRAVWFNQPYIVDTLPEGTSVVLAGTVKLDKRGLYFASPQYEKPGPAPLRHTGRLVPVYPETEGMTSKFLRFLVQPIVETLQLEDHIPEHVRVGNNLMPLQDALRSVHFPEKLEDVDIARERLAFDDVLLLQLKTLEERRRINLLRSPSIPMDAEFMRTIIRNMPFTLTKDQRVAAYEILKDTARPYPMNRLLEGDVGSGKTAVAFLAAAHIGHAGMQTAFLAPTEVLAQQHERTLRILAQPAGMSVALLTASGAMLDGAPVTKAAVKHALARGQVHVCVGTHAMLQGDVRFQKLALAIIDEQHRFGIAQRSHLLRQESSRKAQTPHLLSMTATPIPRTLALTVLGDLDISVLKEKPKNRLAIQTEVVAPVDRERAYARIREQVALGRQVFIICPAIERPANDVSARGTERQLRLAALWAEVKAVQEEYARLKKDVFPEMRIGMLHGKLKAKEKEAVMRRFAGGWLDIIVTTSVIEVGVDVPNATVMMIEGADRFGLAQLHQFRGRVGRAEHQSYCLLVPTDGGDSRRLALLAKTTDGFALAEHDLRLRGPGEFFGLKQSGMPDIMMSALTNAELIQKARAAARTILHDDPTLARAPLLRQRVAQVRKLSHLE